MHREYFVLEEDKLWLKKRIAELEKSIQDLGPDFYDVFNQSSETWHDNAPFDALRDKQSVLFAELTTLKRIRSNMVLSLPQKKAGIVNIGTTIIINGKKVLIAGTWTPRAGQMHDNALVVSAESPLAREALGQSVGATTQFGVIENITK